MKNFILLPIDFFTMDWTSLMHKDNKLLVVDALDQAVSNDNKVIHLHWSKIERILSRNFMSEVNFLTKRAHGAFAHFTDGVFPLKETFSWSIVVVYHYVSLKWKCLGQIRQPVTFWSKFHIISYGPKVNLEQNNFETRVPDPDCSQTYHDVTKM